MRLRRSEKHAPTALPPHEVPRIEATSLFPQRGRPATRRLAARFTPPSSRCGTLRPMNARRVDRRLLPHAVRWSHSRCLRSSPRLIAVPAAAQSPSPSAARTVQQLRAAKRLRRRPIGRTRRTEVLEAMSSFADGSLKSRSPRSTAPATPWPRFCGAWNWSTAATTRGTGWSYPTLADPEREPPVDNLRDAAEKLLGVINRIERVDVLELPGEAELRQMKQEHPESLPPSAGGNTSLTAVAMRRVRTARGHRTAGQDRVRKGGDGKWRFTPETVRGIDELYESLETLPPMYREAGAGALGSAHHDHRSDLRADAAVGVGRTAGADLRGAGGGKLLQTAFAARAGRHRRKNRQCPRCSSSPSARPSRCCASRWGSTSACS